MKNSLKLFIPILFFSFSMLSKMNACSCIGIPETFVKDFKKDNLVIHIKVLEHLDSPEPNDYRMKSITKLKVLNVLNGNLNDDIVYFMNGEGSMCQASIEGMDIGKEMILKPGRFDSKEDKNKTYLNGSICSRWMQPIENGRVSGNVTKNRMLKRYNKMNKLQAKGDEKSKQRWKKLSEKPLKTQRIRIKKLKRILSRT